MDLLTAIRQPVTAELEQYKTLFDEALKHSDDYLGMALSFLKQRRGKMMRPLLVLLVAKECGEVNMAAYRSAVTLEVLHTASLVHDDVVDESDERRGQGSVNAVYGNKMAVLLGDYLLSTAMQQSAMTGNLHCVDVVARLGATLSEGEIAQLANIRQQIYNEQAYYEVIRCKTAVLFACCGEMAAVSMQADAAFVEKARTFGENVGMCFQIRDDLFDYYDDKQIGKPTGNDMREGKLTLPALYALTHSDNQEMHRLAELVKTGEATANDIQRLIEMVKQSGGIEYAQKVMEQYAAKAEQCLDAFQNPAVKEGLRQYLMYVIGRKA